MTARVLVVDDHEPWRRRISAILRQSGWQVIGEASAALEAIQKTKELRPDVVLLDLGLPDLSGIEAAKRILALDSRSRILFVSAHRSWDIAEATLGAGARGYIVKDDIADELLPALDAIIKGERFISGAFTGRTFTTAEREPAEHEPQRHDARFYTEDSLLLDDWGRFAAATLGAGRTFIAITVESHQKPLRERLRAHGVDIDRAIQEGRYLAFNVADALSAYMVDGRPHEGRFWKTAISLMIRAVKASRGEHPRVAVAGEGTATLWRDGNPEAAIRVEQLWDELARMFNLEVLCLFLMKGLDNEDSDAFQRICQEHSAVHS